MYRSGIRPSFSSLWPIVAFVLVLAFPLARGREVPEATPDPEKVTQHALDGTGKILEVPFVATPSKVVDKMIGMAALNEGDVVYDLGCGDGRIVFAAVEHKGVRGVGYDLDPARIEECRQKAKAAGLEERTEFHEQDIFTVDLSPATVVTLYLVPEVNNRLLPKLLRELRPGTRILSHNYGFHAWPPEREEVINVPDIGADYSGEHKILYWKVPEDAVALLAAAESAAHPAASPEASPASGAH